ncbi:MAG: YggS family pyridoxal phosphate-dependent enzyme [Candidatus Omnitrophota bacterium]|nr:MAG: YggS family pyridoxal phosphate-dependent enzyme [Candidatus Omnitrophota bacterium]
MIRDNIKNILEELPSGIELEAATKKRSVSQILEAIDAGIKIIGENYVQEAQSKFTVVGKKVRWHLIGHLQKNKVKAAIKIFDMIETLDSVELASVLDKECERAGKVMPVLIEVNSAAESSKSGVLPENVEDLAGQILEYKNLKLMGLMTMGPFVELAEDIRPFFKKTKEIFDKIKQSAAANIDWKYLSMGMSDTYRIAYQEGANIVRVGTAIFGPR